MKHIGLLISGVPGSGKSRLALALIENGNQLVADDLVDISLQNDNSLLGQAPSKLAGLLHLRHLGLFDVRSLYGSNAYSASSTIDFAITLDPTLKTPPAVLDLPLSTLELCRQKIPAITLNISLEQCPADIVKLLVRQFSSKLMVPKTAKRNIIRAFNS